MASIRRHQKVLFDRAMPVSSKTESPLSKAETISDVSCISAITYLRMGKKNPPKLWTATAGRAE